METKSKTSAKVVKETQLPTPPAGLDLPKEKFGELRTGHTRMIIHGVDGVQMNLEEMPGGLAQRLHLVFYPQNLPTDSQEGPLGGKGVVEATSGVDVPGSVSKKSIGMSATCGACR